MVISVGGMRRGYVNGADSDGKRTKFGIFTFTAMCCTMEKKENDLN